MKSLVAPAALGLALCLGAPAQALTFTSYFAFGDSLTDDGKLTLPLPYDGGRFSSGPVWVEYIEEFFTAAQRATDNFALGGATAGDVNTTDYPPALAPLGTFQGQIDAFVPLSGSALVGDNPLISVLFGANDIFQGGDPVAAAIAVGDGLERLAGLGAQFDDFLVSTLPPLGGGASDPAIAFNQQLAVELQALTDGGADVTVLDWLVFQGQTLPRLDELGITNIAAPCLVAPTLTTPGSDCTIIGFDQDGPIRDLSIADTFLLIDDVHPTEPVHRALGQFAIALVEDELPAPVPLPAGLPLLLGGLAVFGLAARRRSA